MTPGNGNEFDRLAIAKSDRAGFVEQQSVDVARSFDSFAAHGEHVVLHDAVHARNADGGKKAANGGRNEADQQGDKDRDGGHVADAGGR